MAGLHQAMAATVDAYHAARIAGHPVVAIVVGTALSGGFLTHGLQANQILALDDPGVEIHAMHKAAAARITLRTVDELDELAKTIVPMSYDVQDWAKLGFCDGLLTVANADDPTPRGRRNGRRRDRRRRSSGPAAARATCPTGSTPRRPSPPGTPPVASVKCLPSSGIRPPEVPPPARTTCCGSPGAAALPADAPAWAVHALRGTPWVVVRRDRAPDGLIAVGVRGTDRSQRYGTFVATATSARRCLRRTSTDVRPAATCLRSGRCAASGRCSTTPAWRGDRPAASASNWPPATRRRPPPATSTCWSAPPSFGAHCPPLASLHHAFGSAECRVDCQVETPCGAVALAELVGDRPEVLVRTAEGPRLVDRAAMP